MGTMFQRQFPGYKTEIIGDRQGNPHRVTVKVKFEKARAYEVTCQGGRDGEGNPNPALTFTADGENGTSKATAERFACEKYRYVMDLKSNVHINVRMTEVKPKVGDTIPAPA